MPGVDGVSIRIMAPLRYSRWRSMGKIPGSSSRIPKDQPRAKMSQLMGIQPLARRAMPCRPTAVLHPRAPWLSPLLGRLDAKVRRIPHEHLRPGPATGEASDLVDLGDNAEQQPASAGSGGHSLPRCLPLAEKVPPYVVCGSEGSLLTPDFASCALIG